MKKLKFFLLTLIALANMLILFFNLWAASGTCYHDFMCEEQARMWCDFYCQYYYDTDCALPWPYSNWCCSTGQCCTSWWFYCGHMRWVKGYWCYSYHWACVPEG